jgi:hypothetical protein
MIRVRDSVIEGVYNVVMDLAMEEKYQKVAMRTLDEGMRYLGMQFEAYMHHDGVHHEDGPATGTDEDFGFWEPPRFETEVCCMKGMECYSGAFANAAGRAAIIGDIARLQTELVGAKEIYDVLNAEQEREAAADRAVALADARDFANRLVN